MNSLSQGDNTSKVEVSYISSHGFWIKIRGRDHFMSYADFPVFKDHSVESISHVVEASPGSFRWPHIDIDLTQASIEIPEPLQLEAGLQEQVCL